MTDRRIVAAREALAEFDRRTGDGARGVTSWPVLAGALSASVRLLLDVIGDGADLDTVRFALADAVDGLTESFSGHCRDCEAVQETSGGRCYVYVSVAERRAANLELGRRLGAA